MVEIFINKSNATAIELKRREDLVRRDGGEAVDSLDRVFRASLYERVANMPEGEDNVNWTLKKGNKSQLRNVF